MTDLYHIPHDDGKTYRMRKFVEYQHEVPSIHYRFLGEWIKKYGYDRETAVDLCWLMSVTYNEITCVLLNELKKPPEYIWSHYKDKLNFGSSRKYAKNWVFFNDKYRELFRGADNWNMKFSIITLDEEAARKIEVGVPSPQERLAAMHEYTQLSKGGATLRLRPFIIGVTDKTYIDLIREAHKAGATAVTTEFFCLEMRSVNSAREHYNQISEVCGFDIVDFYRKHSTGSGYLRLNRKIKEPYIRKMQELCQELGMRFYVSDAHFKECSDNCCCCALNPNWNYSRGHFGAALQIAKKTGSVRWKDIEPDMYFLNFIWNKAQGFNKNTSEKKAKMMGMTMKDYLHSLWNDPKQGQSPYKIFAGVLVPDGFDEDKNIIYRYNPEVTFQTVTHSDYELKKL